MVLPLMALVFALVFGVLGLVFLSQAREMARDGVEGVATVTGREIRTRSDRDGSDRTEYLVGFQFRPTSDQLVTQRAPVSRRLYDRISEGQEIGIRYLPRDPARAEIEPRGMVLPVVFLLVAAGALAAGLALAGVTVRRKASLLRAARRGEVREARVTGHEATSVKVNGRVQYRFHWVDAAGAAGVSAMNPLRDLPAVGAVVAVYVDPRTGRGWWDGDFQG